MRNPLLITLEYPPDVGGVAKYLEQEVLSHGNVVVLRAKEHMMGKWPQWLPLVWSAFCQLRQNQRDSLWVSHILPVGYVAYVYKKLFKVPYLVYLHGLDLVRARGSRWKRFWIRKILSGADEVIVNSMATGSLLAHYDINPNIAHVRHPRIKKIDVGRYKSKSRELRQKYKIDDKPLLLTISRLVKRKGIDLVIRALPDIYRQIPDLVYVVIGDGEDTERLKELARAQQNIIFTGAVSDQEKYGWLSSCDCFILTPRDDPDDFEGYGIVYKEAQMFGKPVIGSKSGGVAEAIGEDGVIIEPNNVDDIADSVIMQISSHKRERCFKKI